MYNLNKYNHQRKEYQEREKRANLIARKGKMNRKTKKNMGENTTNQTNKPKSTNKKHPEKGEQNLQRKSLNTENKVKELDEQKKDYD